MCIYESDVVLEGNESEGLSVNPGFVGWVGFIGLKCHREREVHDK